MPWSSVRFYRLGWAIKSKVAVGSAFAFLILQVNHYISNEDYILIEDIQVNSEGGN